MQLKAVLAFAPYIVIGLLCAALLWARGDKLKAEGEQVKLQASVDKLTDVAKTNSETIRYEQRNRAVNDEAVKKLAADVNTIKLRRSQTVERIREIYRNDPVANDWANVPVPDSVRQQVNQSAGG